MRTADIDAVLFDFSDVVGQMRMAMIGEAGESPYRIELIEPVAEAIFHLRKIGIKTALVTNNDREGFAHHAPHIDLENMFDVVVFSSDVGTSKPGFAIYAYALKGLDVDAHQALFIDDIPRNVDAAIALGMQGVVAHSTSTVTKAVEEILSARTRPTKH